MRLGLSKCPSVSLYLAFLSALQLPSAFPSVLCRQDVTHGVHPSLAGTLASLPQRAQALQPALAHTRFFHACNWTADSWRKPRSPVDRRAPLQTSHLHHSRALRACRGLLFAAISHSLEKDFQNFSLSCNSCYLLYHPTGPRHTCLFVKWQLIPLQDF